MIYAYDTEFIENAHTIDLISIGIVAEDGREYYAVNGDAPWRAIRHHDWLMANVVPSLPQIRREFHHQLSKRDLGIDFGHPCVKPHQEIAESVKHFLLRADADQLPHVELWADYAAYDHVALCQLWGTMVDLPEGMPMWTHDLQQAIEGAGGAVDLPEQQSGQHHALEDARHVMNCLRHLGIAR